jgi:hypothetical protein
MLLWRPDAKVGLHEVSAAAELQKLNGQGLVCLITSGAPA